MTDSEFSVIAVDWSGNKDRAEAKKLIWLAEARDNQLHRLESGKGQEELIEHLILLGRDSPTLVVGLDFAFSAPAWFVTEHGADNGPDFWKVVKNEGEGWLTSCPWPFWGKKGKERPQNAVVFRATETEAAKNKHVDPKSVFQIAGAGAVGTGSIRGMPYLLRLLDAGWHVWPFTKPGFPLAVEIFPRLLIGRVNKNDSHACYAFLNAHFSRLDENMKARAASNDSAFDAAVSALDMARHASGLASLQQSADPQILLEGEIWHPNVA